MTKSKFKPYVLLWLSTFAIGALAYVPLYATSLTNDYDGLWESSWYCADRLEISVGRWFWPVLDTLRQGYAASLFNSLLMLALIACGTVVLFDCFDFVGKRRTYLYAFLVPVSVTVCAQLSFRHQSPSFGMGFFLSVLAVWLLAKENSKKFFSGTKLLSVVALTLTLGLYQAFLGVFCVVLLFCFLCRIAFEKTPASSWRFLLGGGAVAGVSCVLYKIIWEIVLLFSVTFPSSYLGADSITVGSILTSLPHTFLKTYRVFFDYFFGDSIRHTLFQRQSLYIVLFCLLCLPLICCVFSAFIKKEPKTAFPLLLFLLIPPAASVFLLVAPEAVLSVQTTSALSLVTPLLLIFADNFLTTQRSSPRKIIRQIRRFFAPVLACVALFGNVYMVGIDLETMSAGRTATETLMTSVCQTLAQEDPSLENQYLFVGFPSENPTFAKSAFWNRANGYAHYGQCGCDGGVRGDLVRRTYNGIFRNIGVNIVISPDSDFDANRLIPSNEVAAMPIYPREGSIQKIGDYTIVKISDLPQ